MNLKDWLSAKDRTLEWLAGEIGVSVGSASRMVRGLQNVPLSIVARIEEITDHEVQASDLLGTYRAASAEATSTPEPGEVAA